MALIVKNYVLPDETILEEAYLKVWKIQTALTDHEFFENVNDPLRPDIDQELKWITRQENNATIYIWPDKGARDNRAPVVHWFPFNFQYDLSVYENIYEQVYAALEKKFPNSEGC